MILEIDDDSGRHYLSIFGSITLITEDSSPHQPTAPQCSVISGILITFCQTASVQVTREFCQWVADIGGSNNVEESTIVSLFASGYETKPALAVPIHVVELSNVPPELRMSASMRSDGDTSVEPAVCIAPHMDHWKRGWVSERP